MKLALGCVQFGLDYGITNQQGQVANEQVRAILARAAYHGIKTLDTAALYGDSETVLGQYAPLLPSAEVITKLGDITSPEQVRQGLETSLTKLNRKAIHGLLLHRPDILLTPQGAAIASQLNALKEEQKISLWGVSVYHPEQLIQLCNRVNFDLVQLPLNIFDQRFLQQDLLKRLNQQGISIHARSLLLQGLLCQGQWPAAFNRWQPQLQHLKNLAKEHNINLLPLALSFCHQVKYVERFVLGCQSVSQLDEIVTAYKTTQGLEIDFSKLACNDLDFILPSNWPPQSN
ncbi:aldo/keto reductase [Motilimonas sp. KMU-193]|uniref:aldo/keto reductase n=1 Tax=Motilimonas sp. KMU-193 TaxID=3388668 RepID=UPI00396B38B9